MQRLQRDLHVHTGTREGDWRLQSHQPDIKRAQSKQPGGCSIGCAIHGYLVPLWLKRLTRDPLQEQMAFCPQERLPGNAISIAFQEERRRRGSLGQERECRRETSVRVVLGPSQQAPMKTRARGARSTAGIPGMRDTHPGYGRRTCGARVAHMWRMDAAWRHTSYNTSGDQDARREP